MKKYTINQIKKSKSVLIVHPCFGSLVIDIKKVLSKEKIVEGLVWNETGYFQYNMPDDYHGEYEYMNFPFSCIKKLY